MSNQWYIMLIYTIEPTLAKKLEELKLHIATNVQKHRSHKNTKLILKSTSKLEIEARNEVHLSWGTTNSEEFEIKTSSPIFQIWTTALESSV